MITQDLFLVFLSTVDMFNEVEHKNATNNIGCAPKSPTPHLNTISPKPIYRDIKSLVDMKVQLRSKESKVPKTTAYCQDFVENATAVVNSTILVQI